MGSFEKGFIVGAVSAAAVMLAAAAIGVFQDEELWCIDDFLSSDAEKTEKNECAENTSEKSGT